MRRGLILVGLALLILPPLARILWHYRGVYQPSDPVELPSFSEIESPKPPIQEVISLPKDETIEPSGIVLFDAAHSNQYRISEIASLTQALSSKGAAIQVLDDNAEFDDLGLEGRLKYVSGYVVVAPFEAYSAAEIEAVRRFVEDDGRLLVITDPTRSGSSVDFFGFVEEPSGDDVAAANQLLEPLDLSFSEDYLYNLLENEGNFRNVFFDRFDESPLTEGLETVTLYAARSVRSDKGQPLVMGTESVFSSRTDAGGALAAASISPNMGAVALGDLTFFSPPYDSVTDNARFIQNLADFLLSGDREQTLVDFPFLFGGPVALVQSNDFMLKAETLSSLQAIQTALQAAGTELMFPTATPEDGDLLIVALFDPDAAIIDLLEPLGLILPSEDPDGMLQVPGFGSLNPTGIGVAAISHEEQRTMLALLAEDEERLVSLLESLSIDLLSDCLTRGSYALCEVGEGEGFDSTDELTDEFNFDSESEETFD